MNQIVNVLSVEEILAADTWYRATTLRERIALLQHSPNSSSVSSESANKVLKKWQEKPFFSKNGFSFEARLEEENISTIDLLRVLSEPDEVIRKNHQEKPHWLQELSTAFSNQNTDIVVSNTSRKIDPNVDTIAFLNIIEPLIEIGVQGLNHNIQCIIDNFPLQPLPIDARLIEITLSEQLQRNLLDLIMRTMVLELNVAKLQGQLNGATSEERFNHFIQNLKDSKTALTLLSEYPVLTRLIITQINHWLLTSLEFIERLCGDWEIICATFGLQPDDVLTQVDVGQGDTHRKGRSVCIITFKSNTRLVYKPRSLSIDIHFQELLTWLNMKGFSTPFRVLKMINQNSHGWVEFVENSNCTTQAEVERFYKRQGGLLALLYVLQATDFHHENLIASGEYPVLVDLETLFYPRVRIEKVNIYTWLSSYIVKSRTVLRSSLLPERLWGDNESEGIDASGMGGIPGQLSPYRVPAYEDSGTDAMRFVREHATLHGKDNRPMLKSHEIKLWEYTEQIIFGFSELYHLLIQWRDELNSPDGPLMCFACDEVRYIARSTISYMLRLKESTHPNLLRDAAKRDIFLDSMWDIASAYPTRRKLIPYEITDLQNMDIPIFTTFPASCDIWSSSGERIVDYFEESGLSLAQDELYNLDELDLTRQIACIRVSLKTFEISCNPHVSLKKHVQYLIDVSEAAQRKQLQATACDIGNKICTLAHRDLGCITWLDALPIKNDLWTVGPLNLNLYDGIPGIGLFFAYLGATTFQTSYTNIAREILATILETMTTGETNIVDATLNPGLGIFEGIGSIIYYLTHLSILWNEPDLLSKAEQLTELLPSRIENDRALDIMAGSAGCIIALLRLYQCKPSQSTLAVAIQCGEHLLRTAKPMEQGIGWHTMDLAPMPLTGFSHGAAGIAHALLELAAVTGDQRFYSAGLSAIAYERSLYSLEHKNWPDLRVFPQNSSQEMETPIYQAMWCHGAAGIGLSRLSLLKYIDTPATRAEIQAAIETTLSSGFGTIGHSLCHGDLGNVDLLLQASEILQESSLCTRAYQIAGGILKSVDEFGWICGTPGIETLGLMTGLSGIGYSLLRLAFPKLVPSIMTLDLPKA